MYDVDEVQSFLNLRNWITSIRETIDEVCQIVILGNKIDLVKENERSVQYADGAALAKVIF